MFPYLSRFSVLGRSWLLKNKEEPEKQLYKKNRKQGAIDMGHTARLKVHPFEKKDPKQWN